MGVPRAIDVAQSARFFRLMNDLRRRVRVPMPCRLISHKVRAMRFTDLGIAADGFSEF
jgi:hypothetical protein